MATPVYKAHIECNKDGWYSIYVNEQFPFGFFGEGATIEEAHDDFIAVFEGMRDNYYKRTGEYVDAEFEFVYDVSALLNMYKPFLTLSDISHATGINRTILSEYANGRRVPQPEMRKRIVNGIHNIGRLYLEAQ